MASGKHEINERYRKPEYFEDVAGQAIRRIVPKNAVAINANDDVLFTIPGRIYCGSTGTIKVIPSNSTSDSDAVIFSGVQTGDTIPVSVTKVFATDTNATSLVLMY